MRAMSYLVLARKYRPRNFLEMVGQPHVVTALGNALAQKRLHHAYLFTGTRGVGKTTVARILAKSLNCIGPDGMGDITAEPCGVCDACRAIDAGNFVDYTELDAASNRGVDEIQQLLEQAVYKPVQGRFKVFMIDEVHMLTNTAFNAMLKTLEEPPEYLKFVLATTDPQKVPVTVLSRCLQFNLRPMAPETVLAHLTTVLSAEQVPAEPAALTLLSRAARGSMRDALSLTDQAIAFGAGQVQEATVRQMLGAVDRQHVFSLVEALAQADGRAVVSLVDQARAAGLNAASLLEDMAQVLQHMAVIQAVGGVLPPGGETDPDQQRELALAAQLPRDETQLLYSICVHGRAELGLAPDEYAGLTMVLLRLLAFKPEAEKKTLESGASRGTPVVGSAEPILAPAQPAPLKPLVPPVEAPPAPQPTPAPIPEPEPKQEPEHRASHSNPQPAPSAASAPAMPEPVALDADNRLRSEQASEVDEHDASEPEMDDEDLGPPSIPPWDMQFEPNDGFSMGEPAPVADPAPRMQVLPVREPAAARDAFTPSAPRVEPTPLSAVPLTHVSQDLAPAAVEGKALPALVPSDLGAHWHDVVTQLVATEAINGFVRELALQSELVARDGARWQLRCPSGLLGNASTVERLQAAMQEAGYAIQLDVAQAEVRDTPSIRNQHAQAKRLNAARDLLQADPFVLALQRDFGATIVAHSVKPL